MLSHIFEKAKCQIHVSMLNVVFGSLGLMLDPATSYAGGAIFYGEAQRQARASPSKLAIMHE